MKTLMPFLFCFVSLALLPGAFGADDIPDDTVVTLQRHTCDRRCAVYKVILFADGTVIYDGQYKVRRQGLVLDHVDPEMLGKLIDTAKAINYFSLKSEYSYHETTDCDSLIPDGPIVNTSVTAGGQSKGIIHHHRCAGAIPAQLTAFENAIDKLANTARWTK
jgi:hypothetical protein